MKHKLFLIFSLIFLIIFSNFFCVCATTTPNVIYVSPSGADTNNGLSSDNAKKTIQNAVETAQNGDTIMVASGIYPENIVINKSIILMGESYTNTTIVGSQNGTIIKTSGILDIKANKWNIKANKWNITQVVIMGFTIKNRENSRGISNCRCNLTMNNSVITQNQADWGGGIYNIGGNLNIDNSIITCNHAKVSGGGISSYRGNCTLNNCIITGNHALYGGGIDNNMDDFIIINCKITQNQATYGGGIYNHNNITPISLINTTITDNQADYGGGIYNNGTIFCDRISIIEDNHPDNIYGNLLRLVASEENKSIGMYRLFDRST